VRDGQPRVSYESFHEGQRKAFWSTARVTLVLAGTQGGKTAVGPPWLLRQIKERGPGDYIVAAPTFALMEKKVLPELLRLFRDTMKLGDFKTSPVRKFVFSEAAMVRLFGPGPHIPVQIFFGYGEDPDSLESMTAKAAWLDEPGQKKFKRESFDAIMRRLSIEQGPVLLTTTPYLLGWLSEMVDKAAELGVNVINFPSIANPRFSLAEWERAKAALPPWKFNMFYRGIFERPAGMIYDCWSDDENIIPHMAIPDHWPRFLGLDFGGVNTAALFVAKELTEAGQWSGRFIGYRDYHAGGKTAEGHTRDLLRGEPMVPTAVGGSKSEGQWRAEFAASGLGVYPPVVTEVEVGIDRVYGLIKPNEQGLRRFVILDSLKAFRDEVMGYTRPLDENGEPMEGIEDKEQFHRMDSARYILSFLAAGMDGSWVA
jgi:hypothetical protein